MLEDERKDYFGRPVRRKGRYQRITIEIREDLLARIDAQGVSRRSYVESLLIKELEKEGKSEA